jgi:Flp pilus assembly pilin Flp
MRNKMLLTLAARLDEARREEGQGMVEYALILFLISIGAVVLLTAIGWDIQETFDAVEEALGLGSNAPTPGGDDDAEPGDLPAGGGS